MALYFIGIGLNDEKDISIKGLETIKKCDVVYLENYTSILQIPVKKLEELYCKKIILANRDLVEKKAEASILKNAKEKNTAFLVIGDPLSATTHIDLMLRAKKAKIPVEVIHNASVISAIGITGLEVYKFGKITSIPFNNKNIKTPVEVYNMNKKNNLHTLFLLDLDPENNKFMTIKQAVEYLTSNGVSEDELFIGCARIGSKNPVIYSGKAKKIIKKDFGKPPYCLIIPGKLHFIEEEAL
jgi:diphthine synthase